MRGSDVLIWPIRAGYRLTVSLLGISEGSFSSILGNGRGRSEPWTLRHRSVRIEQILISTGSILRSIPEG